ncbi:MAG: cysteine--tRNA ligase [Candidatus Woesearchaeota archaeon]
MDIRIYNTATKKKENFVPLVQKEVGIYCCGPTVYNFAHLGNMRAFLFEDTLVRVFAHFDYRVKHVMNITDVGHLTDDGDDGEDKMLKGAKREKKTVWDIAHQYTLAFFSDCGFLNIQKPTIVCKATDHIPEMIELIQTLEKKGFTYVANGNVYFDTQKFPEYAKFANLNMDDTGKSRVEKDTFKKHPRDFVLWFTKSKFDDQAMKWDSPWGTGYPGWHIECSAMSTKYLGETFDIHCGGADHIPVHHTNEIAQSKCAHDSEFARYWMHNEFLIDQTGKMAKSKGDFLTVQTLIQKGYDPLAYRYLCAQTHYRKQIQFSFEALDSAQAGLKNLREKIALLDDTTTGEPTTHIQSFEKAISDDLNIPKALAVVQNLLADATLGGQTKKQTIQLFDTVLGLNLISVSFLPKEIQELVQKRKRAREQKDFEKSDLIRDKLAQLGYKVIDSADGQKVVRL